jgi:hypothetical protein
MQWKDFYRQLKQLPIGTVIPKAESEKEYRITRWFYQDGQEWFSYSIANKSIPISWVRGCFDQIQTTGELRTAWFRNTFYSGKDLGSCNFTTIGGLFVLLGAAERVREGVYSSVG